MNHVPGDVHDDIFLQIFVAPFDKWPLEEAVHRSKGNHGINYTTNVVPNVLEFSFKTSRCLHFQNGF